MLNRKLSIVEFDELFKSIEGYERIGDTISIYMDSGSFHFHAIGWTCIMDTDKCVSIVNGNMSIVVGLLSNTFMVSHIPGLQNPECVG
jgi:hypothetical protein